MTALLLTTRCCLRHILARAAVGAVLLMAVPAQLAKADFRLCNNTGSRVGVSIGYKDGEGWTTEGWWNVSSRSCETLLRGALVASQRANLARFSGEAIARTFQAAIGRIIEPQSSAVAVAS